MDCYKEFAHIYDELINSDIDYSAWASKILGICSEYNIDRKNYLDLACGTGNLTIEIVSEFKHIWAVDLSSDMLCVAEKKIRDAGIKAKFLCRDICELNLNLNNTFNLITCCLDSTNYILEEENFKKYLLGVYDLLKEDGLFVFDVNSYYKLTKVLGNNTYNFDSDNLVYIWENYLENDIVEMSLTFFAKEGQVYRRFDEQHSERAYKEEYIESVIKEVGLEIIKKMDNYEDKIVCENTERICYVLKK
ncbi:class I SAM-dependent methyltransferase [Clostridium bowmanii]|uniref:class I SAM-dependent DNA methyltransferase n=1 Tax=Clostridium bowmanii TaxID=132925 RepID=UPI001C0D1D17|nr:class I SAM-dependent methyltransferase [Clostridium bowmanii]MBU3189880.1 class I SAM-dependent methyltransferase [Clostridium bowmanii]MCA1074364.1 class I SAM-dependent methyltransferase [Clostridium bowmanii]